jgi:hypothetical protein
MFHCYKNNQVSEPCCDSKHDYLDVIHKKHKNTRLRFLLLLPEEDYRKCIYSHKDLICARKSRFPGKLIIEKFEEVGCLPFAIEGPPMPRQLYIMLPKEKLFIRSNHFTARYIDSKMNELKQLFVLLRAKKIKFTRNMSHKKGLQINGDVKAGIPSSAITAGSGVSSMEFKLTEQSSEMHFTETKYDTSIEEVLKQTDFYFLSREFHWQNIITRRLDNHLVYDKYTYKNEEMNLFQMKFKNQLDLLGLQAEYDWEEMRNLEIEYEIEYYPV